MHITPTMIEGAYRYLLTTPPFNRWKFPDPEEISFRVTADRVYGWYDCENGTHRISVSIKRVGQTISLIETVAHEMIHVYQAHHHRETPNSQHNKDFYRRAKIVCAYHGFDYRRFW